MKSRTIWILAGVVLVAVVAVVGYSWHSAAVAAALAAAAEAHRRRAAVVQDALEDKDKEITLRTRARVAALREEVQRRRKATDTDAANDLHQRTLADWPPKDPGAS